MRQENWSVGLDFPVWTRECWSLESDPWEILGEFFLEFKARKRWAELGDLMPKFRGKRVSITRWSCMCVGISSCCENNTLTDVLLPRCFHRKYFVYTRNRCHWCTKMDRNLIWIFAEQCLKCPDHLASIVRNWKNSLIVLTLEADSMWFEPFYDFLGSEFPKRSLEKISSTRVFREENFAVADPSCDIAASSTWDRNLSSEDVIFLK